MTTKNLETLQGHYMKNREFALRLSAYCAALTLIPALFMALVG